jgi:hypothetical protein
MNERPKRARKPSWKALEEDPDVLDVLDALADGSSVEAILPSYVSSGSSLRSLSGSGEENDAARVVPDATGMGKQQGSGGSEKQGSNEAAKDGLPDTNRPLEAAGIHHGVVGVGYPGETTKRGLEDLKEYYHKHQTHFLEHMTSMINLMSAKAQQMVMSGENLASIKMQEALHAVSTANAIIWRSSSVAPDGGTVQPMDGVLGPPPEAAATVVADPSCVKVEDGTVPLSEPLTGVGVGRE